MIDHILWAVPELTTGCRDLTGQFGVSPQPGGRHPGVGTHNALVGLDGTCYLEIIAPDPTQCQFSGLGTLLRDLQTPRLLTWCARADDLESLAERAEAAGLAPSPITAMDRRRLDGSLLSWRLLFLEGHDFGQTLPFFIDWRDSDHPSSALPSACHLEALTLGHPRARALGKVLDELLGSTDPRLSVVDSEAPSLEARCTAPQGVVHLKSR